LTEGDANKYANAFSTAQHHGTLSVASSHFPASSAPVFIDMVVLGRLEHQIYGHNLVWPHHYFLVASWPASWLERRPTCRALFSNWPKKIPSDLLDGHFPFSLPPRYDYNDTLHDLPNVNNDRK
jgi:hypothetical protein